MSSIPRISLVLVCFGCNQPISAEEALQAVEQALASGKGEALVTAFVELSTQFTLGQPPPDAAAQLGSELAEQLPCALVSVQDQRVTLDLGELGCSHAGQRYTGLVELDVEVSDEEQAQVNHSWTGLDDGQAQLDGAGLVLWEHHNAQRQLEHELHWADHERVIDASGERDELLLDAEQGLDGGLQVAGLREWNPGDGAWSLQLQAVQLQGADPVPRAGRYLVTTTTGLELTLSFAATDGDVVEVTMSAQDQERVYRVNAAGEVRELD